MGSAGANVNHDRQVRLKQKDRDFIGSPSNIWYNLTEVVDIRLFSREGGGAMSIYEALSLMIAFGSLIAIIMKNK